MDRDDRLMTRTDAMPDRESRRLPAWLLGSGIIAVAMGIANLSTYGFTIIAARLLGPSEYGALAAVMGLLLVVNVVSLGLQATGARGVSADPENTDRIEADVMAATYKSAIALGLLCLLAVPLIANTLRLDSWWTATLIAATSVPVTVMGGQAGLLQGERRWLSLAGIYVSMGLGRIVFGTVALVVRPDTLWAMVGVALGATAPVVVGWFALRQAGRTAERSVVSTRAGDGSSRRVLRELTHNSHALLAFFALSNADVVIARVTLDDHQGGLYAGGLILAKAVLFLPQFVVVIAFPSMSEAGAAQTMALKALGLVLAIGAAATAVAWQLSDLAVMFVGGEAYAELSTRIWAFAAIGTLLAMTQLMVYSVVARQNRGAVFAVWAGLLALAVISPFVESMAFLLSAVVIVESSVLIALLALNLRRSAPTERV